MRQLLAGHVLAMMPSAIETYRHMLTSIDAGVLRDVEAAEATRAAGGMEYTTSTQAGAVAVIPVYGMIQPRRDIFMAMFGGTSMVGLSNAFRDAMGAPGVKAIVLDFDTPGGAVYGVTEVARQIRAARGVKPIVSVVNGMCASAGYWLASSADEIVARPSSECGSIGCFIVHVNSGKAAEAQGYEVTLFSAGDLKPAESGVTSLSDEQRASIQSRVDSFYSMFVSDIAKGRGVAPDVVRRGYGRGGLMGAAAAKEAGLVDRIATLDETLARLGSPSGRRASMPRGSAEAGHPAARAFPYGSDPEDSDLRRRMERLHQSDIAVASGGELADELRNSIDTMLAEGYVDARTELLLRRQRLSLSMAEE